MGLKSGIAGPWNQGRVDPDPVAWTWTWTPGNNLENFFALYDYHALADASGDFTATGATSIATTLDGPIQVAKFRGLTVNHALTASQRCRGLMPIADTLSMGASGSISMAGMGAAGHKGWAIGKDIFVPASITFTGKNTSLKQFLDWIRSTGYCIFDPSLYACPPPGMGDVTCDWATWVPYGGTIISAAGCGAGAAGQALNYGYTSTVVGLDGSAGTTAPGGGGSGGVGSYGSTSAAATGKGGKATPWGGGPGSAATASGTNGATGPSGVPGDDYGGPGGSSPSGWSNGGGGAGNPGGSGAGTGSVGGTGTGGVLLVIVKGAVSLTAGHAFTANGMPGGAGGASSGSGGGGSGGGKCGVYYLGALTGSFNQTATGGAAGTGQSGGSNGGAGGAGHAENKTFAVMGW